jgi:transposase
MSTEQNQFTKNQYRRIQGGRLIEQGYDNQEIVEIPGCSLSSVRRWRKTVDLHGVLALEPKPIPGRTPKLNIKQLNKLKRLLKKGAIKFGDANAIWTSRRVRQLIKDQFHVSYSKAQTCRILRKIGDSPKKPVKRSKKYSPEAIKHWIRSHWSRLKKSP